MGGGFKHQPQGEDAFIARLIKLQDQINDLRKEINHIGLQFDPITNSQIISAGRNFRIDGGNMDVEDGDVNLVGGNLIASGGNAQSGNFASGSAGWQLQPDGNAEFNSLTLRNSIIGNDALTSPVSPAANFAVGSGYTVPNGSASTGGGTTRATCSIAVPSGYTKALVFAVANDWGFNGTASDGYLYSMLIIGSFANGVWANASSSTAPANTGVLTTVTLTALLTGLNGGTVSITSNPYTDGTAWPADSRTSTVIDALALFLR